LQPGGELWLSGIFRSQQKEVARAYRAAGLRHLKTTTRGKWAMQHWARPT
jgi:ribosomal protein L11 methylase PrmA